MKTIGRILIILAAFSLITGMMVTAVNASGINAPNPQFRPNRDGGGLRPQGDGNRPEHGERGGSGSRLMLGAIRNMAVIGFLVIVIVWPKSVVKKKKRTAAALIANGKL